LSFTVRELPTVSLAAFPELCENDAAYTLVEGNPTGGIYSGTGINGNEFDPGIGAGNYNITYTYQDGFGCENSDQNNLEVLPVPCCACLCHCQHLQLLRKPGSCCYRAVC
jgi:hypothetical protein